MKIPHLVIITLLAIGSASAQTLLIDFGDLQGSTTGNWNNSEADISDPTAWAVENLITTTGASTTIDLVMIASASGNVTNVMGVTAAPSPFNVATAYNDAIFTTGADIIFDFEELDASKQYRFTFFGSRDSTAADNPRITSYTVDGATSSGPFALTTSGTDVGGSGVNHNIVNTAQTGFISPDAVDLDIRVTVELTNGSFAYLNAMKIEVVPEPGSYALLAGLFALGWIMIRRRR